MRSKARITITLARDLLKEIDQMIDQREIRNRSHAIELLLRQSLTPSVKVAAILAGGVAKSRHLPALRTIGGRTLIETMVGHLVDHGVQDIYILAGENAQLISNVLSVTSARNAHVVYVDEQPPRGTAGAVKLLEKKIGEERLLVVHGDILTDIDLTEFVRFHEREGRLVTVAVKPREAERRYGKVMLQGNRITQFSDRDRNGGVSIVNTGVYLLQTEALGLIESRAPSYFESSLFPHLAAIGELGAFMFQGLWFDISENDNYLLAQDRWGQIQAEASSRLSSTSV